MNKNKKDSPVFTCGFVSERAKKERIEDVENEGRRRKETKKIEGWMEERKEIKEEKIERCKKIEMSCTHRHILTQTDICLQHSL